MTDVSRDRLSRRPPPPIPILVLTGFLGAGKTTLLNRWVRTPEFSQAAVLINEFGDVGIDHLLVEKTEGTMLTLSSGCLCCSVRGDLVTTLEDLIRGRDNDRIPPFDRLVIETTGLAEPGPILNALMAHPYLPMRYRVDAVVTVIDALHGASTLEAHEEARQQAAIADTLIVTKTDLVPSGPALESLMERLRVLNPRATVLNAVRGEATSSAVLRGGAQAFGVVASPSGAHEHDHHHDHTADHHHGDEIQSIVLSAESPLDPAAFSMFVDLLRGTHGARLLRIKGLVALRSDPTHPIVIHGVQHYFHPPHRLDGWPDDDHRSRLVFITNGLDPAVIAALWSGFFGGPAIDRPDGAALAQSARQPAGLLG